MKKIFFCILIILSLSVSSFAEFILTPTIGFSHFKLKNPKTTLPISKELVTNYSEISWLPFTVGLGIGHIGLTGFSFMWNNDFSVKGNFKKQFSFNPEKIRAVFTNSKYGELKIFDVATVQKATKGFYWSTQVLFGYTIKLPIKLRVNLATGLDLGLGKSNMTIKKLKSLTKQNIEEDFSEFSQSRIMVSAGIPLNMGVQYYFIKFLGLNVEFEYIPSYSYLVTFSEVTLNYSKDGHSQTEKRTMPLQSHGINHQIRFKIGPIFKL